MRVVCNDHSSLFDELLEEHNSCKIHGRNLITEIFKVKMNLAPEIMKEVFEIVEVLYALRNELKLKSKKLTLLSMALKQHFLLLLESVKNQKLVS